MSSVAATPRSVEPGEVARVAADLVGLWTSTAASFSAGWASTARMAARPTLPVPQTTVEIMRAQVGECEAVLEPVAGDGARAEEPVPLGAQDELVHRGAGAFDRGDELMRRGNRGQICLHEGCTVTDRDGRRLPQKRLTLGGCAAHGEHACPLA
jgi:hypothetical protein